MVEVVQSDEFRIWLEQLRDRAARARILVRLQRVAAGNFGDIKPVGDGVSELRFTFGPGYRVYIVTPDQSLVVVLAGGDKSTQPSDIALAKGIAERWRMA